MQPSDPQAYGSYLLTEAWSFTARQEFYIQQTVTVRQDVLFSDG